jgi:hypothetical protein
MKEEAVNKEQDLQGYSKIQTGQYPLAASDMKNSRGQTA